MAFLSVLIVEDDQNDEALARRALAKLAVPIEVSVVASGPEALTRLENSAPGLSSWPDLILVDHSLPGMSGDELIARIRSLPMASETPIVLLSGNGDERVADRCLKAGANQFVTKPMDYQEYLSTLSAAVLPWAEAKAAKPF